MNSTSHPLDHEQYISLVTFRKNGASVATPMWFATDNARLYAYSEIDAGKIKRIRANPKVEVAACNFKGVVSGPAYTATAMVLDADQGAFVHGLLNRKYTWKKRLFELAGSITKTFRKNKGADAFIAITLD